MESRWSCSTGIVPDGGQCEIEFTFGSPQDIVDVEVDFFKGDERARTLEVCTFDERYKFQQLGTDVLVVRNIILINVCSLIVSKVVWYGKLSVAVKMTWCDLEYAVVLEITTSCSNKTPTQTTLRVKEGNDAHTPPLN